MANNTLKLHRVFTAPIEKVFKAFVDADAMASWLPSYGFVCKVHNIDVRVGGTYKMSFTNFMTGKNHSFGGKYTKYDNLESHDMLDFDAYVHITSPIRRLPDLLNILKLQDVFCIELKVLILCYNSLNIKNLK